MTSRLLYFPDENHWVLKPQNSLVWHHTVQAWLDRWLGLQSHENALQRAYRHSYAFTARLSAGRTVKPPDFSSACSDSNPRFCASASRSLKERKP